MENKDEMKEWAHWTEVGKCKKRKEKKNGHIEQGQANLKKKRKEKWAHWTGVGKFKIKKNEKWAHWTGVGKFLKKLKMSPLNRGGQI